MTNTLTYALKCTHTHTHTHTHFLNNTQPSKKVRESYFFSTVDGSLSRELCIGILEDWTYRRIHSKESHPHTGARSHSGRQVPICTEIHRTGWSSKRTVLEVEGMSPQGCPCLPEGQSSQGLDPETSRPVPSLLAPR